MSTEIAQSAQTEQEEKELQDAIASVAEGLFGQEKPGGENDEEQTSASQETKKEETTAVQTSTESATSQESAQATQTQQQTQQSQQSDLTKPPSTWRTEAKDKWMELPEWARQEVYKRETDTLAGIGHYKKMAEIGDAVSKSFEPHAQLFQENFIPPDAWMRDALQMTSIFIKGTNQQKLQMIDYLMRSYDIKPEEQVDPIQQVLQELAETDPVSARAVAVLHQQNQQLQSQLTQQAQQSQLTQQTFLKQEEGKLLAQVQAFAADPAHPHFTAVAPTMLQLVKMGETDLQKAYDKAIWMIPEVRELVMKGQATQKLSEEQARANKARQASSTNVSTSAKSGSASQSLATNKQHWEDALGEYYDKAAAAS